MNKLEKHKNANKSKKEVERLHYFYNVIKNDDITTLFATPNDQLSLLRFTDMGYTILHLAVCLKAKNTIKAICQDKELSRLNEFRDANGDTPCELSVFCQNFEAYQLFRESEGYDLKNLANRQEFNIIKDPTIYKEFLEKTAQTYRDLEATDLLLKISQISPRKVDINPKSAHTNHNDSKSRLDTQGQWQWNMGEENDQISDDGPNMYIQNLDSQGASTKRKNLK